MASVVRPSLLRQALAAPGKRTFSASTPSATPALRTRPRGSPVLLQRAAFQTSTPRSILPALPQKIDGTVNDPVKTPEPEPGHGSYHWTAERLVSAALVPMTIAPFAAGSLNPLLDGVLIGLTLVHSHIGFQSIITDYIPKWRLPRIRKLFDWGLNLALLVVGWGWYEFETNDVGLTEAIKRIWTA